jgi:hypothetical protein
MIRNRFDGSYIIKQLLSDARHYDLAVVETIRTTSEVDHLKILKGKLFAVDASRTIRYARLAEKLNCSFKEFECQEINELFVKDPQEQNLVVCVQRANHFFHNNYSTTQLHKSIDVVIERYL